MLKSALSIFLISCLLGHLDCTVQTELTVKRGEDATLQCHGHTDATIILLRWEKPDLQSERYVFYVRNGKTIENYQHPRFKDRVKLKEPEMKNGDFTVILTNVFMNDAGTYECHAGYKNQRPQLINSIILKVEEPGTTGGHSGDGGEKSDSVGLNVGLSVLAVLVVVVGVVVGFLINRKCLKQSNPDYQPPADQGIELPVSS